MVLDYCNGWWSPEAQYLKLKHFLSNHDEIIYVVPYVTSTIMDS